MKNFEVLRQMPQACFANMIFDVVKNRCETPGDFEDFLDSEIKPDLEVELKEALKKIQQSAQRTQKKGDREELKKEQVNARSEKTQREEIKEKLTQTISSVANKVMENEYPLEIEADAILALAILASTRANMI